MLGQAVGRHQKTMARNTDNDIRSAGGGITIKGDYKIELIAHFVTHYPWFGAISKSKRPEVCDCLASGLSAQQKVEKKGLCI